MSDKKISMESTLAEVLEIPAALELFRKVAPDIADSPVLSHMINASMEVLANSTSGAKARVYTALVDVANGREVDLSQLDDSKEAPQIITKEETYNIDDIDGRMYMLDHSFTGCLVLRFSKEMDEGVYGKVTCNGKELKKEVLNILT